MIAVDRALLLVDVIKDFEHEDGDRLLADYRKHHAALLEVLSRARADGQVVAYANDGVEPGDSGPLALVRRALAGKAGELVRELAPEPEDLFVVKPGYSALYDTPLEKLLRDQDVGALDLAGTATEMCVFQTATDAVRLGFEVTVLAQACASVDDRHEALALDYLEQVLGIRVVRD
jgi:nicotinamidase-related amidase